jgi:hypothetical protein
LSDSQNWSRAGRPGIKDVNALTVSIGDKVNYFTPDAGTDVLEIVPGAGGMVIVEVEAGQFRCRTGKLSPRAFTAAVVTNRLTVAGHPYLDRDGPLRVEQTKMLQGNPALTFDLIGAANDELIRAAGSWVLDGFESGDVISISGSAANDGDRTIAAISTTTNPDDTLEFAGDVLTDEGPVSDVRVVVGALPTGLLIDTDYWIRAVVGDTFKLALTPTGVPVAITAAGTLGHLIGGNNGVDQNVGFQPAEPVISAAAVVAVGAKKLRTDELQAFDGPVTLAGVSGGGDILSWWTV